MKALFIAQVIAVGTGCGTQPCTLAHDIREAVSRIMAHNSRGIKPCPLCEECDLKEKILMEDPNIFLWSIGMSLV